VNSRWNNGLPNHLLGIWAHPDDEAYLSAGLMGRVTDVGGHVTVLTMTGGEKGTSDPGDYDQPHFAARRERELRASSAELGVHDVRLAGYRDDECDLIDRELAISTIAATITDVEPDLIVTFGPDGITGHRDHRIVSRWVTEAWRRVGGAELLYATMGEDFVSRNAKLHDRIGLFAGRSADEPAACPTDLIALSCELGDAELDRKRRALARHATQTRPLAELMGELTYRTWWRTESFRRPTASEAATCSSGNAPLVDASRVHPPTSAPLGDPDVGGTHQHSRTRDSREASKGG
jgi:LmbE family N-acetylglucosaminyl deacetylase